MNQEKLLFTLILLEMHTFLLIKCNIPNIFLLLLIIILNLYFTFIILIILDQAEPNKINVEGVMRLLEELILPPDSILVLIIAWKCQAAVQCEFTKQEFLNGMTKMG